MSGNCLFRPKKSLGQNFLINDGACRRIAATLDPRPEDNVLEIGPGHGALTKFLLQARRLVLLEKDRQLAAKAAACFPVHVINGDALKFNWRKLGLQNWKITGNLPYNVASPLIWDILSQCAGLQKAVFMVQKEVAERLTAAPGSRHYGALSVWAQSFSQTTLIFTLGPGSFRPPPKVDSAVVAFNPIPLDKRPGHLSELRTLLQLCFQQRRKQLGGVFHRANKHSLLEGLDTLQIDGSRRPEELSPEQFQQLAKCLIPEENER